MTIDKLPSLTPTRKFMVKDKGKFYLVYIPEPFNSLDKQVFELKDVSETTKGREIVLACMSSAGLCNCSLKGGDHG